MPHEIESMMYANADGRGVPWHGLGTEVPEAITAQEALEKSGLGWTVGSEPVYVKGPEVSGVPTLAEVEDYVANIRSSDRSVLAVVSKDYRIVQNHEAFGFVDELVGSGEVKYETAGSLLRGKKIWVLAHMNSDTNILGDKVDPYLLFTNSHDGTSAVTAMITPVRVVCNNTLNMALQGTQRRWTTWHTGDIQGKLQEAKRTLLLAGEYLIKLDEVADNLANQKLHEEQWQFIVGQLIQDNSNSERGERRVYEERIELSTKMYVDDLKQFADTGWGAVNAVADFVAHQQPKRYTPTWRERRFDLIAGGHPMLDKTYELLEAVSD